MYHTHANMHLINNVSIYAHLNIFIWTKISFNTYLTHITKLIKVFLQLSWKNEPSSESFELIHLDGVNKQNKVYSFEVSISLLPLFSIIIRNNSWSKNWEQIWLDGVRKWNNMYSFEFSIGLLPSFQLSQKNRPCSKSLKQIHFNEV